MLSLQKQKQQNKTKGNVAYHFRASIPKHQQYKLSTNRNCLRGAYKLRVPPNGKDVTIPEIVVTSVITTQISIQTSNNLWCRMLLFALHSIPPAIYFHSIFVFEFWHMPHSGMVLFYANSSLPKYVMRNTMMSVNIITYFCCNCGLIIYHIRIIHPLLFALLFSFLSMIF